MKRLRLVIVVVGLAACGSETQQRLDDVEAKLDVLTAAAEWERSERETNNEWCEIILGEAKLE